MKIEEIKYNTLESEQIVQYSTRYAVISLILVSVFMRIWLPKPTVLFSVESLVLATYVIISLCFLFYMGIQSKRRALINKLPSTDILKLCAFVKQVTDQTVDTGCWHVTYEKFNKHAMGAIFSEQIASIIPAHDYFSYMLSEKLIDVDSVTDKGRDINSNPLSIQLSEKAKKRLEIYNQSLTW